MKKTSFLIFLYIIFFHFSFAFDFLDIIPSRLEGKTRGESIHVVELKTGTPRTTLRLALDFESSVVTTLVEYNEKISSTFSPSGGGSDELIIAGKRVRLPFVFDPIRVRSFGCDTCEGLLGVGASSPLWTIWKEVTFGSGAITLGGMSYELSDAIKFNRLEIRSQKRNSISCDVGFPGLCRTEALVGPNKELNTILFSFSSSRTMVPPSVYDAYTFGKNIFENDTDEWDDLELEFINLTNDSKDTSFVSRIRKEDIVSDTALGSPELLLSPQTDYPNTTIIGRPAWRSILVFKNWITNEAKVVDWKVEKEFSLYGKFILSISGVAIMWWKGSESGEWTIQWKFRPFRLIALFLVSFFNVFTIWINETRCSLLGFAFMDIYLQVFSYIFILFTALCVLVHMIMWNGYSRKNRWIYESFLGLTDIEEQALNIEKKNFNDRKSSEGPLDSPLPPSGIRYFSRNSIYHKNHSFYNNIDNEYLIKNINNIGNTAYNTNESIYEYFSNPFHSVIYPETPYYNDNEFHSFIGSQRLWSVLSLSFESLLLFTTFMVWISVREDTLSGFGSLMLFSYIIINSTYHLISQIYHKSGWHNALWYLFLFFQIIFVLTTYAVAIYFIFYPFALRYDPDYGNTPIFATALVSLVLFYFAEYLASTRVSTLYFL